MTQWQVVGAVERISEVWLLPVLQAILEQFPFRVLSFHSDNGSEFINHLVAKLLNTLKIEQTGDDPRTPGRQRLDPLWSECGGTIHGKRGNPIRASGGEEHQARRPWKRRDHGPGGKPQTGFPPRPPSLGNPAAGFPLSHSHDDYGLCQASSETPIRKPERFNRANRVNRTFRV